MKSKSTSKPVENITGGEGRKLLAARAREAAKKLSKYGIKAKNNGFSHAEGVDGPFGILLSLNRSRKGLLIALGGYPQAAAIYDRAAVPEIVVSEYDKKHRQAVVTVREAKRTITRTVTTSANGMDPLSYELRNNFGVTLPGGTKYSIVSSGKVSNGHVTATVKASVPESVTSFLVGFDEGHMFISMLPKKVRTVAQAHQALLPKELRRRKDYVRQGEFFFVPATKKEICFANDITNVTPLADSDGEETDHFAYIHANSENYKQIVSGNVTNRRHKIVSGNVTNRRHKTLFFDRWMRVIPNNEIPSNGNRWD